MLISRRTLMKSTAASAGLVLAPGLQTFASAQTTDTQGRVMSDAGYSRIAETPEDFKRLGLDANNIALWEDGLRAPTESGHYEWWYFDCHLKDGTSIVVFYTKPLTSADWSLTPEISIDITRPDGTIHKAKLRAAPEDFSASKDSCDVRIEGNRFVGDLNKYRITAEVEDLSVDIELTGEVPSWRPKTGHFYFGSKGEPEKLFAWLPSVPQGKVKASYKIGDETFEGTGVGYHDHNWGNAPMQDVMHNWYWGRAKVGPYTVIASYITAEEEYNYQPMTVFLLAKDGKHVVDDHSKVAFSTANNFADDKTGKPVAGLSTYVYADGDTEYMVKFEHEDTIIQDVFADSQPLLKRLAAKALGIDSSYMRLQGPAIIEKRVNGELVEHFEDHAIWEQMYFGETRTPDK
ncbi:lipocalin-like domain-containing protein [Planktotalea sp.]|uniref:lipocalin-like domain-containing protein n=1 Tax=Planktotalea sp. TaxID=2029877 RepID=UPI00329A735F